MKRERVVVLWTRGALGLPALIGLGILGMLCVPAAALAQTPPRDSVLTLNDHRPVAAAVEALISKYRYVITYQEPPCVYAQDLQDITSEPRFRNRFPRGHKVFLLRGGQLTLSLPGTSPNEQQMYELLEQVVDEQNDGDNSGPHFRVEQDGAAFHVVPTEVRDQDGNWQPVTPLLSTTISLATEARTYRQMVAAIATAIGAAAHVKIGPVLNGGIVLGFLNPNPTTYTLGAEDEPASEVLLDAFRVSGRRATWMLEYDPSLKIYVLNIDDVPPTQPTASPPAHAPRAPAVAPPAQNPSAHAHNCHASATSPPCGA